MRGQYSAWQEQLPAHLLGGGATDTEPTDYVLTAATDYKPYVMRAFLNSFRRHNDAARIVVLVSPNQWLEMHDVLCEYGRHYGIEYHSLEPSKYYGVEVTRFRGFMEVLNSPSTANARNIFMADIRDVLFQGDPFSPAVLPAPKESPLRPGAALPYVLFTEEGDAKYHTTFRTDSWDQGWIRDCFNESVLESLMDATVVCAGTTMGGRDAIMAYLQLMSDIAHFLAKESCFVTFGVDQGFHNFIVHYLKPKRPELLRFEALQIANDDSPIYTVGMIDTENRVKFTGDTFLLLNGKGVRPPVVHQVDRKDDFQAYSDHFALGRIWRLQ